MKVDIFDFDLDRSLIATQPADPRDSCKLLDVTEDNLINDRIFTELPDLLEEGDVLVFNDTKVIPARLYAVRGQAEVEVTLYHPVDGIRWMAFIKNAKRLHEGDTITFYTAEIAPRTITIQRGNYRQERRRRRRNRFHLPSPETGAYVGNLRVYAFAAIHQTQQTGRCGQRQSVE